MNFFSKEIEAELTRIFEDVAAKMGQQVAEKCLLSLQTQYQQIWTPFEERVKKLIENLDQTSSKNNDVNQNILQQKQNFSLEMKSLQDQLQVAVQNSLEKLEKTLIPHLDEVLVAKLSTMLQSNIGQMASQVQSLVENLQTKIESSYLQTKVVLDSVSDSAKGILNKLESETKETSERIEANYDQRLSNFFIAQKQHISNWNTNLDTTLKQMTEKHATSITKIEQDMQKIQVEGTKALQLLQKSQSDSQNTLQAYQNFVQKQSEELKSHVNEQFKSQSQEIVKLKGKFGAILVVGILTLLSALSSIGVVVYTLLNK